MHKQQLGQGPNFIQLVDCTTFGSGIKSHLRQKLNSIWVKIRIAFVLGINWLREQIAFESGTESHLDQCLNSTSSRPNSIQVWDQIALGLGTPTQLIEGPNCLGHRIWVMDRITIDLWSELNSGWGTNGTLVGDPITFRLGAESQVTGWGWNHIWAHDRITFGSWTKSHLGGEINCTQVHNNKLH